METNKVLLYGGLAVGAYLLYKQYKQEAESYAANAQAAAATPATPSTLTSPVNIPQSGVIAPPLTSLPNTPLFASVVQQLQQPAASIPTVVQGWAGQYLQSHPSLTTSLNNALQQLNQTDMNMLANVIIAFNNSQPLTPAQGQWWNVFTNKYGLQ